MIGVVDRRGWEGGKGEGEESVSRVDSPEWTWWGWSTSSSTS